MSALDMDALAVAFQAHMTGEARFTRRMAINLADMDCSTPRDLVRRLERLGMLKKGSWDWFVANGGITSKHVEDVRASRKPATDAPAGGEQADV